MKQPQIVYSHLGDIASPPVITEIMTIALENPELLSLAAGFTDTEGLPVSAVRDAAMELTTSGKTPEYLQYGTNQGRIALRKFVSRRLSFQDKHQSQDYNPDNVMITNGSQQALYLAMQALCDPGDIILVENPSYFVFLELLKGLGITAIGMPVGDNKIVDPEALRSLIQGLKEQGDIEKVKGIYLESWFSNPSTYCLPDELKVAVANVLTDEKLFIPVLEDAAYKELYYETEYPSRSIFAIPEFDAFPRLFFGTFTKPFSSGLKVGYAFCDHKDLLSKMLYIKGHHDFGSANFNQAILQHAIEEGSYDKQLLKVRTRYFEKMKVLNETFENEGLREHGWNWKIPEGGLYFWAEGPSGSDVSKNSNFFKEAVKEGVLYIPGDLCFAPGGAKNYMRISFGVLDHENLKAAGKRLVAVVKKFS